MRIQIDTPCTIDWNQMDPVKGGRFCESCNKKVHDFSIFTDQEILDFISANGKVCARFRENQLNRELYPSGMAENRRKWGLKSGWLLMTGLFSQWTMGDSTQTRDTQIVVHSSHGDSMHSDAIKDKPIFTVKLDTQSQEIKYLWGDFCAGCDDGRKSDAETIIIHETRPVYTQGPEPLRLVADKKNLVRRLNKSTRYNYWYLWFSPLIALLIYPFRKWVKYSFGNKKD